VPRGAHERLAATGLVFWENAHDVVAVMAPGVQKNATPSLTRQQAIALLEAIPTDSVLARALVKRAFESVGKHVTRLEQRLEELEQSTSRPRARTR
jgi:hypothetical protein